jgi:hypothetical protein
MNFVGEAGVEQRTKGQVVKKSVSALFLRSEKKKADLGRIKNCKHSMHH